MATFEQSYAESGRQSELDALSKTPGAYETAKARWQAGGNTATNSSSGANTGNYQDLVGQSLKMYQEANQPAVQSLQASIPEISQGYQQTRTQLQGQQTSLEARYKNLLDEISGKQAVEEKRTGVATAQELGRRGISAESGLYGQTVNQALSPVSQYYTGQTKEVGLAGQQAQQDLINQISGLTTQETEAKRQVQNAIAQLQSGGSSQAIQNALAMYNQQQQAQQQAASLAQQERLAQAQQTASQYQSPQDTTYKDAQTQYLLAQIDKLKSGGGGSTNASADIWE